MIKNYHLSVSVNGLKDRLLGKIPKKHGSWEILSDNGRMLTKSEALSEVIKAEKMGYEVIPTCDNIDEKGHCKGHKSSDAESKTTQFQERIK